MSTSPISSAEINILSPSVQLERIIGDGKTTTVYDILRTENYAEEFKTYMDLDHSVYKFLKMHDRLTKLTDTNKSTIRDNFTCVDCGVKAEYFAIYRNAEHTTNDARLVFFHMENGKVVIHTKDHILAKYHGGPNHLDNYQNMCSHCNRIKGNRHVGSTCRIFKIEEKDDPRIEWSEVSMVESKLRYSNKRIKIDDAASLKLYKGEVLHNGKMVLMDETLYRRLDVAEHVKNHMVINTNTFRMEKLPWYMRLLRIDRVIEKYIECYRSHIFDNVATQEHEYISIEHELTMR